MNVIFDGSHGDAPISVEYTDINEVHKQLVFDTLYAKLDYNAATAASCTLTQLIFCGIHEDAISRNVG